MKKQTFCLILSALLPFGLFSAYNINEDTNVNGWLFSSSGIETEGYVYGLTGLYTDGNAYIWGNEISLGLNPQSNANGFTWIYSGTNGTLTSTTSHSSPVWKWTGSTNVTLMELSASGLTVNGAPLATQSYVGSTVSSAVSSLPTLSYLSANYLPLSPTSLSVGSGGIVTTGNIVVGSGASAASTYSLVMGAGAVAETTTTLGAIVLGKGAKALGTSGGAGSGSSPIAIGNGATTNSGGLSIGGLSQSYGALALALGRSAKAGNSLYTSYSVAVGPYTTAQTAYTLPAWMTKSDNVAIGSSVGALGPASIAYGYNSYAQGWRSMVVGSNISANGANQTVLGFSNVRIPANPEPDTSTMTDASITFILGNGYQLSSDGTSFYQNAMTVRRDNGVALGSTTIAGAGEQTAVGKFNNPGPGLFVVGSGSSDTARSNALVTLASGETTLTNLFWVNNDTSNPLASDGRALVVEGHALLKGNLELLGTLSVNGTPVLRKMDGTGAILSNGGLIAIGDYSEATNSNSFAIGHSSKASGAGSLSLGVYNISVGEGSSAVGNSNYAGGVHASAFGVAAYAVGNDSIALSWAEAQGAHSLAGMHGFTTTTANNSISLGGSWDGVWDTGVGIGNFSSAGSATSLGGVMNTARGFASYAMGTFAVSEAAHSFAQGSLNKMVGGSATQWVDTDTLFVLGNGNPEAALASGGIDYYFSGPESDASFSDRSNAITTLKNGQTTLTNKFWMLDKVDSLTNPSASQGNALVVEGNTLAKGDITLEGNLNVKNDKVIRVSESGDISMGEFTAGTNPNGN